MVSGIDSYQESYGHTPHESTKEKPSFLLFGIDLKSPTEASLVPPDPLTPTDLGSYREELVLSLSSARELAVTSIREAQKSYKSQYDKKTNTVDFHLGDWVFVRFPNVLCSFVSQLADEGLKFRSKHALWLVSSTLNHERNLRN